MKINKLHIACGERYFNGWMNIDIGAYKVDLTHDVTKKFPDSIHDINLIYCEHFIEHLDVDECIRFLNNCYDVLVAGGIIRIATFDLDELIDKYITDWKDQCWIPSHPFIKTRAEMINIGFRWWGHKWVYNFEELKRRVSESKFGDSIRKEKISISTIPELCNLETRQNSTLIVEGIKV